MFLIDLLQSNTRELEHVKHLISSMSRMGTVSDVDPVKGYRIDWGEDGQGGRFKSPWMPHPESGGGLKTWMPLTIGQNVMQINPVGDPRQGVLLRAGFSDQNPPPSQDLNENMLTFGAVKVRIKENEVQIAQGETQIVLSSSGEVSIKGAKIILNGPVEMPKGFTAGDGSGQAGSFKGSVLASGDVSSETRVVAPVLKGQLTK